MPKSKADFVGPKRKLDRKIYTFSSEDIHNNIPTTDWSATDNYINSRLDEANAKFNELSDTVREVEKNTKTKMDKELNEVRQRIDESKGRVVETLALFAALFTFLSLQVQIFKDQTDVDQVLGLVLISGGLIAFFVLILDVMIKNKDDAKNFLAVRFFLLLAVSIFLIGAGILIMKLDH